MRAIQELRERLEESAEALMRRDQVWVALAGLCADPMLAEGERTRDAALVSWAEVLRLGTVEQRGFALLASLNRVRFAVRGERKQVGAHRARTVAVGA